MINVYKAWHINSYYGSADVSYDLAIKMDDITAACGQTRNIMVSSSPIVYERKDVTSLSIKAATNGASGAVVLEIDFDRFVREWRTATARVPTQ